MVPDKGQIYQLTKQNEGKVKDINEEEFAEKHKEWMEIKQARKKEIARFKRLQFGESSSDEDEFPVTQSSRESWQGKNVKEERLLQGEMIQSDRNEEDILESIKVWMRGKKNEWVEEKLCFNENGKISLGNYQYDIKSITKLKIMSQTTNQKNFKIKLTYHNSVEVIIGVSGSEKKMNLPLHYYTMGKLIENRLSGFGVKVMDCLQENIPGIPEFVIANCRRYGRLYKKSQVLGKWDERLIVIKNDGLYSYKSWNEKHTMFISRYSVKEIWTRFQQHEDMLIIKIKHNSSKTQFGIPIVKFNSPMNWLYHFYLMCINTNG